MGKIVNQALRWAVMRAQGSGLFSGVRPLLKSVLLEGSLPLSSVVSSKSFASFIDENGNKFKLIEGLRDAIKPGWRWVLQPDKNELPDKKRARARYLAATNSVKKALSFLECFGFRIEGATALEIGCWDGSRTFSLAANGAAHVIGSDISRYYVRVSDTAPDSGQKKFIYLEELRKVIRAACESPVEDKVRFLEDDITKSGLPSSSFNFVCTWGVLEHVREPARLFAEIERLLKPGGVAFHEYNPFFSVNGGHSHCTLDFLWGHVLLCERDFEKYLARFRPAEAEEALHFYKESLNRMTIADLKRYSAKAGLKNLALIPWTEKANVELLTSSILRRAMEKYPELTVQDMTSPWIWLAQMKI